MRSSLALSLVTYLMQMRSFGRSGMKANQERKQSILIFDPQLPPQGLLWVAVLRDRQKSAKSSRWQRTAFNHKGTSRL
ncbi:hypothetical protein CCL19_17895 [Pseudomonas syringae]|nr:hypothetical protein CCL19_17895 [Pseudomonas syringae]